MLRINLSLSLKILAIVLWYFIPVFIISVLNMNFPDNSIIKFLTPEIRGGKYPWDFELMFTSIFLMWGIFLWVASKKPNDHQLFVNFSIYTFIVYGLTMVLIGSLREGEFLHLLIDGLVVIIPACLVLITKYKTFNLSL